MDDQSGEQGAAGSGTAADYVLAVQGLTKIFPGQRPLYSGINLVIRENEIVVIIGESGIGKSVFLSLLVGLLEPSSGEIWYRVPAAAGRPAVDVAVHELAEEQMAPMRLDVGIVFQESSLFDWMTVYENISLPLLHHPEVVDGWIDRFLVQPAELCRHVASAGAHVTPELQAIAERCQDSERAGRSALEDQIAHARAQLRMDLIDASVLARMAEVRLDVVSDRNKLPSQLSGGMKTRVGIARTLALRPHVLLYDEPTAGLDPVMAKGVANAILDLQQKHIVRTSIVVTHDKELYWTLREAAPTRLIYLHRGRFLDGDGKPVDDLLVRQGQRARPPKPPEPETAPTPDRRDPTRFIAEFTSKGWRDKGGGGA